MVESEAQGRLPGIRPVSIVDIGSNSVRLVIYEGLSRTPSMIFNEKVLCGLGRGLATTGMMNPDGVEMAIRTLKRFRVLMDQAGSTQTHVLATAAARESSNGPDFVAQAEAILGCKLNLLSGEQEALYAAMGIIAGMYEPDGIVGDLGGASLELIDVKGKRTQGGITLPLGGLRLMENASDDADQARIVSREHVKKADLLTAGKGRTFYAIGGTWRSIAKLHMEVTKYPLHMMQSYEIELTEMVDFLKDIIAQDKIAKDDMKAVSKNRRGLLPFGAAAMLEVIEKMQPKTIRFSAYGVREGYLYSLLDDKEAIRDPLLAACEELALLRARSPQHAKELADWTGDAFPIFDAVETASEARFRRAACLLADISWRAHPDYRGDQALNIIAHGSFVGVTQAGRAYIALTNYFRYEGLFDDNASKGLQDIATPRLLYFSKLLGGMMRILYLFSASMPGIIPKIRFEKTGMMGEDDPEIALVVPKELESFVGDRVMGRIGHLEKLTEKKITVRIE